MADRIRNHIRSDVIACLALFLAVTGGSAYALDGSNTVFSDDIVTGEVKSGDIGDLEITANDIAPDSLGTGKIADRSVKNADLGLGASSSNTIADGGIEGVDVKSNTLTGNQVNESTLFNDNSLTGADVDESALAGLWRLSGNAGTGAGDFLGTTDNQPLQLRVNGVRALRIEPAFDAGVGVASPNLIGGSPDNRVTAGVHAATIAGGGRGSFEEFDVNEVTDHFGTVGGGAGNHAGDGAGTVSDHQWATVSGGSQNSATGEGATVGGGLGNQATAFEATVSGGGGNIASANGATAIGGAGNFAEGDYSFAAGRNARVNHDGAFVWADGSGAIFPSTADFQFSVRAQGGARFVSAIDVNGAPSAGVELAPGGGSWSSLSDAASKRAIERVSGRDVLRALASVPISTWSYRAQEDSIRHIGPMAQDFYRAFGVGEDRRRIASVDADGVALAAIKGLSRELRAERRRRHEQDRRLDRLEARLAALERRR